MTKPNNLETKIFLDSGSPTETQQALDILGFLDGQTTNPSLVVKNPDVQAKIATGNKLTNLELLKMYEEIIQKIRVLLPNGAISIEVYADQDSTTEELLDQAKQMDAWIKNAHIKFPIISSALLASQKWVKMGKKANMTLAFSETQAMSVHLATQNMKSPGDVFISPFIGRLDDTGYNGLDLISNIKHLYKKIDSKVEILAASVRSLDHFLACLALKVDIITAPLKVLKDWKEADCLIPVEVDYETDLKPILPEENLDTKTLQDLDISHPLTAKGLDIFASDWKSLVKID